MMQLQNQMIIEETTDQEGTETENEMIRETLEGLEDNQRMHTQGVPAGLYKGLESDLETIFETDLESNYITTARTNLSTKKLLAGMNLLSVPTQEASHERLNKILLSQFSPINHSGCQTTHNSTTKTQNQNLTKEYSSMPNSFMKQQKASINQNKLNMKMKEIDESIVSPGGNITDTSQSGIISGRSNA